MQQQTLQNIMTHQVVSVSANQSVEEAAQLMSQYNIGAIPVIENGKVTGMVTDRDLTLRSTATGGNEKTPVSQVMTNEVICATPNMSVEEASQLMAQNQVRRLPVVENNQVVGMVALGDLATNQQYDNQAEQTLSNISTPSKPQH